jgi:c-di-GMP-binding flagellar brake protein YcgR
MDTENIALLDEENDIYIEVGAKLNIAIEGSNLPVESIFVGNKIGKYFVITSSSQIEAMGHEFSRGKNINVKYLYQRQTLEFQTKIIEVVSEPIHLILVEYPKAVQERNLRSQKRINCFISAIIEVEIEENNEGVTGVIKDISKSGCRFLIHASKSAENIFRINEQITLKCHFPGIVGDQEALGRVKDIQKKGEEIAVGIQFSDIMWWVPPYA